MVALDELRKPKASPAVGTRLGLGKYFTEKGRWECLPSCLQLEGCHIW